MTSARTITDSPRLCAACGAELAAALLACPSCGTLVHADTLKRLAAEAAQSEREGDATRAMTAWRQALQVLPAGTVQHQRVQAKVQALSAQVPAKSGSAGAPSGPAPVAPRKGWRKLTAVFGTLVVLLAKFKGIIVFLLATRKLNQKLG